jgi:hypothetical protein
VSHRAGYPRKKEINVDILNLKEFNLITFLKRLQKLKHESAEIETGMAEKSRQGPDKQTAKTWFGLEK